MARDVESLCFDQNKGTPTCQKINEKQGRYYTDNTLLYEDEYCSIETVNGCPAGEDKYYPDRDSDGQGDSDTQKMMCSDQPVENYVTNNFDCDDTNNTVYS